MSSRGGLRTIGRPQAIEPADLVGAYDITPPSRVERNETFGYSVTIENTGTSSVTFDLVTVLSGGGLASRVQIDRIDSLTLGAGETSTFDVTVVGSETREFEPNDYTLETLTSVDGVLSVVDDILLTIEQGIGLEGRWAVEPQDTLVHGAPFSYTVEVTNLSSSSLTFDLVTVLSGGSLASRFQLHRIESLTLPGLTREDIPVEVPSGQTNQVEQGVYTLEVLGAGTSGTLSGILDVQATKIITLGSLNPPKPELVALGGLAGGVAGLGLGTGSLTIPSVLRR